MTQLEMQEMPLVRLGVSKRLVAALLETPLGLGQTISSRDGEIFLDVFMPLTQELVHWIQCMGTDVEVIHPPGLRELIREELAQTLHLYRLV
ncbi:MAG: WYL domain-containing protein [Hydrogenophaga sp.]|uniref:WYL domain-containing protein n=1 Tax=Hydrogenophaga sp. TaxID=1904254 RepID=UPI002631AD6F|nr:WYL domain-containing protein [Hydrogenophaga sp.]MDM7943547.1 WYL domain-containing protein [Hydrogenophaga sp.]